MSLKTYPGGADEVGRGLSASNRTVVWRDNVAVATLV
jgi:hypothetical protein